MKLYIPEIKDQLTLAEDWTFELYPEKRNVPLGKKLGLVGAPKSPYHYPQWWVDNEFRGFSYFLDNKDFHYNVTLLKGTILQVDRIYIRKGNSDYSSLTFYIKNSQYKGARFWAKLKDVNNIKL